ncbi:MAG: hypothetical protein V2A34_08730 [Lentisphaerota bacterium]
MHQWPADIIAPTQTEESAEIDLKPLRFKQSHESSFPQSAIPAMGYPMYSGMPAERPVKKKKNWSSPSSDIKDQDTGQDGEASSWGWLADEVGRQQNLRAAENPEKDSTESPFMPSLTANQSEQADNKQVGFKTELFEPVIKSSFSKSEQGYNNSPDNLLAGRQDNQDDTLGKQPVDQDRVDLEERAERQLKQEKQSDINYGMNATWGYREKRDRDSDQPTMFPQTRELLAAFRQPNPGSQGSGQSLSSQSLNGRNTMGGVNPSVQKTESGLPMNSSSFLPMTPGIQSVNRSAFESQTIPSQSFGFQSDFGRPSSLSGVTEPLKPMSPTKPMDDSWSGKFQ